MRCVHVTGARADDVGDGQLVEVHVLAQLLKALNHCNLFAKLLAAQRLSAHVNNNMRRTYLTKGRMRPSMTLTKVVACTTYSALRFFLYLPR